MKNFYLILVLCTIFQSAFASEYDQPEVMDSSVTLIFGGGSANVGEDICIPLYGENFTDIIGFQWKIEYDQNIFSFTEIIPHPNIEALNINSNEEEGTLSMLFQDPLLRAISIDSLPIMEICFNVIGEADIPTFLAINNNADFPVEVIKSDSEEAIVPNVITENIFINNNLDCGLILACQDEKEYVFSPGMVIHKSDFIEDYQGYLKCNNLSDEDLKLINMSAPNALPSDSLIMTCENVFHHMTIGIVTQSLSTVVTDDVTTNTLVNIHLCSSSVIFNIPDNLEDCTNTLRSCIDPLRCKSIGITVEEPLTIIKYSDIIDSENFDACEAEISNQFESIAQIPDEWPDGFPLYCGDYKERLLSTNQIVATIGTDQVFASSEWCNSVIEIRGIEEVCANDSTTYQNGYRSVAVLVGEARDILLNETSITRIKNDLFTFHYDLLNDKNAIKILPRNNDRLQDISTIDLVMQYKILIDEIYSAPAAIAADVDLSGSLTTKDLGLVRLNILGVNSDDIFGPFILERNQVTHDLDYLDFTNDYHEYIFSKGDDIFSGYVFELYNYGNVSDAVSQFHKSAPRIIDTNLSLADQSFSKGDIINVPISILSEGDDPVVAFDLAMEHSGLEFQDIKHKYSSNQLLVNSDQSSSKLGFFMPKNRNNIELILQFKAIQDGQLSKLLKVDNSGVNEVVTENLKVMNPELEYSEEPQSTSIIKVYPNPTVGTLYITVPPSKVNGTVSIYNNLGQLILNQNIASETSIIDLKALNSAGLLHVTVFDGVKNSAFKIIAQ